MMIIGSLIRHVLFAFLMLIAEVFTLHMEELRSKQEEISKKDHEIKVLEAIIQTLSRSDLSSADN